MVNDGLRISDVTICEDSRGCMTLEWHDESKPYCIISRELVQHWISFRLTEKEFHAVEYAAGVLDDPSYSGDVAMAVTMRGLLKRHGYDVA